MQSWKRVIIAALFSLLIVATSAHVLAAEEIPLTPVADIEGYNAVECTVEPANRARVLEIAGDAANDPSAVLDEQPPIVGGEAVTGADAEATIALMRQLVACLNQFDYDRLLALLSDDLIERAAYDLVGSMPGDDGMTTDGVTDPNDRTITVQTSDVLRQPDGRLTYSVTLGSYAEVNSDHIPVPFALVQIIAVEQRGAWKIDDLRVKELGADEPTCGETDGARCATPVDGPECGASDTDGCRAPVPALYVVGEGYAGWLMTTDATAGAASWFLASGGAEAASFQVTEEEVAEAESALPAFVTDQPRATDRLVDELNSGLYERQYLGFTTPEGRFLIINAYCDGSSFADPATTVTFVMDGGDCYWYAVYDLDRHTFVNLSVNGDA